MRPSSPLPADAGPATASACLDESTAFSYVHGGATSRDAAIQGHVQRCADCRVLIGEAARAVASDVDGEAVARTLSEGQLLCGRYRIGRFLARGGMGEVYEAYDELLRVPVAVKTLLASALDSSAAFGRLRAEVVLARTVVHPNVCRLLGLEVHDRERDGGSGPVPFIVMELLVGETLTAALRREGAMSEAGALPIVRQLVAGLEAIHAAGILHRDFKSDNVMLVPDGARTRVVVMDFGLARPLRPQGNRSFSSNTAVGTLDYMAPEQALGRALTAAADVYALGVVMFELVTGRRPFTGIDAVEVTMQRLSRPAPRASSARPDLDPRWDDAIARCLAPSPARRFERIGQVLDAVATASPAWPRRRRALAMAGIALAGLALAAVGVAHAWKWWHARAEADRRPGPLVSLDVDGTAPDWEPASRGAVELPGRVYCLEPLDEHRIGMIWGEPRSLAVLDVRTRALAPWPLPPDVLTHDSALFESHARPVPCPRLSPDGRQIAYEGALADGRRGIHIVAASGDGPPRLLAFGRRPAWSPRGDLLAFLPDDLHAAVVSPATGAAVVLEKTGGDVQPFVTSAGFDTTGDAIVTTGGTDITRFSTSSHARIGTTPLARFARPAVARARLPVVDVLATAATGRLFVASLDTANGKVLRRARFADGDIWALEALGADRFVVAAGWDHITVRPLAGSGVPRPVAGPVLVPDANVDGDIVYTTVREDVSVALYVGGRRVPVQLPANRGAAAALFAADGRSFTLYARLTGARHDTAFECQLSGRCAALFTAPSMDFPALSPGRRRIVYVDYERAAAVQVRELRDGKTIRLTNGAATCHPRWLDDDRLWVLQASEWREFDVPSRSATGRTVPAKPGCRAATDGPQRVLAARAQVEHRATSRIFVRK